MAKKAKKAAKKRARKMTTQSKARGAGAAADDVKGHLLFRQTPTSYK